MSRKPVILFCPDCHQPFQAMNLRAERCKKCRPAHKARWNQEWWRKHRPKLPKRKRKTRSQTVRAAAQDQAALADTHPKSVFAALVNYGHDEDYEPSKAAEPVQAVQAMPGSRAKVEAMALRVRKGQPLWAPGDWEADSGELPADPGARCGRQES